MLTFCDTRLALAPTPTERGIALRPGHFATLNEALGYAARARTGMNFHDSRGTLVEALPYSVLAVEAREAAGRLLGLGLVPGDRIGLVAETDADFVRAFVAAVLAGLVPCPMPLPTAFGARTEYAGQLRRIADVAGVSAVILAEPYRVLVADALGDKDFLHFGPLDAIGARKRRLPPAPAPDALAYLQFSSGTTRAPRGIGVTHRALMANLEGMAHALELDRTDRGMSWLPFYHDMGLVGCLLLPIATQMSVDFLATRDFIRRPGLWPTMISRARATVSYAPSFGYQLAAQRARLSGTLDLSSWRVAGIGGDMVKAANLDEFARVYGPHGFDAKSYLPSYGMAELALGFTFTRPGTGCRTETLDTAALERGEAVRVDDAAVENARAFARCGFVLPGHECQVRDDRGRVLGAREVGRVFARGPSVMQGYFGDPAATEAVLSTDGWLETGDKGYVTEAGELVITGRSKDLIIINGRNIWPQDIEWTLENRLEGIREGAVAAFRVDDAVEGGDVAEEGLAVVLEYRGSDPEERQLLQDEADAIVRTSFGLAPDIVFSRPGMLPRTTSGKLSRARAREMHRDGHFHR